MITQDKAIKCFDCSKEFTFSAAEQEDYRTKGRLHDPKRCPACRQVRKERQMASGHTLQNPGFRAPLQMHAVTCASCGKATEVPFQPRQGRPVYCRDCYGSVRLTR